MVTLLITSVLILVIFSVAIYFWQKPRVDSRLSELPPAPPPPRALFGDATDTTDTTNNLNTRRESLVGLAAQGNKSTLRQAHALNNSVIYDEVLTALVDHSPSDANVLSLTSHITKNEWPVNKRLAAAFIDSWQKSPDRTFTAKMLHIAALSDDAETYRQAVELALRYWREGKLPDLPAVELNALIAGEFWLLSNQSRSSGAGFILKHSLAAARRELERKK